MEGSLDVGGEHRLDRCTVRHLDRSAPASRVAGETPHALRRNAMIEQHEFLGQYCVWLKRWGAAMSPLDTDAVLREEAKAIHGSETAAKQGKSGLQGVALYQALNALNRSALCLSGGEV